MWLRSADVVGEGIIRHRRHARAVTIALTFLVTIAGCSPSSNGDSNGDAGPSAGVGSGLTNDPGTAGSIDPGGVTAGPTGFHATEGPVPAEHARAEVDGRFIFFNRVVGSCTINGAVILFAHRATGTGPDLVTGSSNNGWIRLRLSRTSSVGYRMRLGMSDPGLELDRDAASFSLTGPATLHTDVDDLGDPGTQIGDMTVTVAC